MRRIMVRSHAFGGIPPQPVSEGGLEPPMPFGALAPQASASAYSATRTGCWGPPEYGGSPAATLPNGHPRPRRPATTGRASASPAYGIAVRLSLIHISEPTRLG